MRREEVIEKVKKILKLAENNPNENEAISATLKAQKLMVDWNIDSKEVIDGEVVNEEIIESKTSLPRGKKQNLFLGGILADAFRCRLILRQEKELCFIGYESDVLICQKTFSFLSQEMEKLSKNYVNEQRKSRSSVAGLKESYQYGFLSGLREQLEKQSFDLMIVRSPKVDEKVKELFPVLGSYNHRFNPREQSAMERGRTDARSLYESGFVEGEKVKRLT